MDKSARFWDKLADKFDTRARYTEQTHARIIEITRGYLHGSMRVLDFGCATGTAALEIADRVKEVHGIDISSKMIDIAQRKAAEGHVENSGFSPSTIFDERFAGESFDVILAFCILHLLENDTGKVVQRVNELLRPGGLFISATPCLGERKTFFDSILPILMKTVVLVMKISGSPDIRFFTIAGLEDLIVRGHFRIVETERLPQTPANYFIVAKKGVET